LEDRRISAQLVEKECPSPSISCTEGEKGDDRVVYFREVCKKGGKKKGPGAIQSWVGIAVILWSKGGKKSISSPRQKGGKRERHWRSEWRVGRKRQKVPVSVGFLEGKVRLDFFGNDRRGGKKEGNGDSKGKRERGTRTWS